MQNKTLNDFVKSDDKRKGDDKELKDDLDIILDDYKRFKKQLTIWLVHNIQYGTEWRIPELEQIRTKLGY